VWSYPFQRCVVGKNLGSAVALGFGKENASAVIKALEKEAGVEVKARARGLIDVLSPDKPKLKSSVIA